MKYIKGAHRHGSETFLLISKNKKNSALNAIYKRSTTQIGIKSIISEYEGLCWYNERSNNKIISELKKYSKNYFEIKIIPNKNFFKSNSGLRYLKKKKYFELTINHYIQIWNDYRGQEYGPLHGDLSLVGNVLFNNKDEVLFIDWEHFENNKKIPIGLDPIMMLLENIWYEINNFNHLKIEVLNHFVESINTLKKAKLLSPLFLINPAKNSIDFIRSNTDIWRGQHNKLPALRLSEKNLFEIDNAVCELR